MSSPAWLKTLLSLRAREREQQERSLASAVRAATRAAEQLDEARRELNQLGQDPRTHGAHASLAQDWQFHQFEMTALRTNIEKSVERLTAARAELTQQQADYASAYSREELLKLYVEKLKAQHDEGLRRREEAEADELALLTPPSRRPS